MNRRTYRHMKVDKNTLSVALWDLGIEGEISHLVLGHEEHVTIVNLQDAKAAARYMAALAIRLYEGRRRKSPAEVHAALAGVEMVDAGTRAFLRFRGWELVADES